MSIISLPNTRTAHPLAGMTLYHGTPMKNINSILDQGILPRPTPASRSTHVCLTTDITCALYYGLLIPVLEQHKHSSIAIIAIPGETINPDWLCVESGTRDISAYGGKLPGRDWAALNACGDDWHAFLNASSCVGVKGAIPVRPDWIDARFDAIKTPSIKDTIDLGQRGAFSQTQILDILAQAPKPYCQPQQAALHAA